jgi:hypothetical protein
MVHHEGNIKFQVEVLNLAKFKLLLFSVEQVPKLEGFP